MADFIGTANGMSFWTPRRRAALLLFLSVLVFVLLAVLAIGDAEVCTRGWDPPSKAAAGVCAKILATGDLMTGPAVVLFGLLGLTFSFAGYLISSARAHPIGWILFACGLMLLAGPTGETYTLHTVAVDPGSLPLVRAMAWIAHVLAGPVLFTPFIFFFLLFPDGHLPSRRWRWLAGLGSTSIAGMFTVTAFHPGPMTAGGGAIHNPLGVRWIETVADFVETPLALSFIGAMLVSAASTVIRYRRARGEQRLQLKWFATATTILAVVLGMGPIFWMGDGPDWAWPVLFAFGFTIVPVSVVVAILRYRLYDIDLVINRTLVYGTLTVVLAAAYFGIVVALQRLIPGADDSQVTVAGSTLAVAGLFRPLRTRIQGFIDRRFYRAKYDTAHTLEAFSERLRDQVDLNGLTIELVQVVKNTMQPAHASLWLRAQESER